MKTGKYAKAVEKMEQMLSLYPDEDWFKVRLASALLLNGELDKAGEIAEALIDKDYLKRTVIFNDEFENNEEAWYLKPLKCIKKGTLYASSKASIALFISFKAKDENARF